MSGLQPRLMPHPEMALFCRPSWSRGKIERARSSLHAKAFAVDRETMFIGSLNLDARSVVQNTEIGVVMQTPGIATGLAQHFDDNIDDVAYRVTLVDDEYGYGSLRWHGQVDGERMTFDSDPSTTFWRRLGVGFMRLLPIESQI